MTTTTIKTVSLAPTADGLRHMRHVFQQTQQTSERVIHHVDKIHFKLEALDEADKLSRLGFTGEDVALLHDALQALEEREQVRCARMEEGITECTRALGEEVPS